METWNSWFFHYDRTKNQGPRETRGRPVECEGTASFASRQPLSSFSFLGEGEEMGETAVMAGCGLDKAARCSVSFDTPCGSLLRELEVRFSARTESCLLVWYSVRSIVDSLVSLQ